jgi:hypothetical protein
MDVEQTQEGDQHAEWWSVVQAIAWIVEGTSQAVERAASVRGIQGLQGLRLRPTSRGDGPPVSLSAAPADLLRAARLGRLMIHGRQGVTSELQTVPVRYEDRAILNDLRGQLCFGDEKMQRAGQLWLDLSVRADECRRQWPERLSISGQPDDGDKQDVASGGMGARSADSDSVSHPQTPCPELDEDVQSVPRRRSNKITADDDMVEILHKERIELGDNGVFSLRAAIRARIEEIEGNSEAAIIRRLTRKYTDKYPD